MALLTKFEELQPLLNLSKAVTEYPALPLIQDSVEAAIAGFIGRTIKFDKYKETLWTDSYLIVNALPIKSIVQITLDGVVVDESNYKRKPNWIEWYGEAGVEVVVTYKGGFETYPAELKRAATLQTVYEYQNRDHIGANSIANEGGSVQVPELGLLKEVQRILKPYKHPLRNMF